MNQTKQCLFNNDVGYIGKYTFSFREYKPHFLFYYIEIRKIKIIYKRNFIISLLFWGLGFACSFCYVMFNYNFHWGLHIGVSSILILLGFYHPFKNHYLMLKTNDKDFLKLIRNHEYKPMIEIIKIVNNTTKTNDKICNENLLWIS